MSFVNTLLSLVSKAHEIIKDLSFYAKGMNGIVPNKLIGNDNIRRCDFVEVGVILLEEVCHCVGGL